MAAKASTRRPTKAPNPAKVPFSVYLDSSLADRLRAYTPAGMSLSHVVGEVLVAGMKSLGSPFPVKARA